MILLRAYGRLWSGSSGRVSRRYREHEVLSRRACDQRHRDRAFSTSRANFIPLARNFHLTSCARRSIVC